MTCRIAAITDLHHRRPPSTGADQPDVDRAALLKRVVEELNERVRPDVTVLLGDLLDDPSEAELLRDLRTILDQLNCPWLAIPGNHDPAPAFFYAIFPWVEHLDVKGVRLVSFVDEEQPEWNACRTAAGFEQMARAASGYGGVLVALQHVPVGVPGRETPYGYTNYEDVAGAMRRHGYRLALSGHYHEGRPLQTADGVTTMTVPALGEPPFSYALVMIEGETIRSKWCQLAPVISAGNLPA